MSAPERPSESLDASVAAAEAGGPSQSPTAAALVTGALLGVGATRVLLLAPPGVELTGVQFEETRPLEPDWVGRLPFADGAFDAIVLLNAAPLVPEIELTSLARECLRVARAAVVQVEQVGDARLARLVALWKSLNPLAPRVSPVEAQASVLVIAKAGASPADGPALASALADEKATSTRLQAELNARQAALEHARAELAQVLEAPSTRIARRLLDNRLVRGTSKRTMSAISRVRNGLRARGLVWPHSYAEDPAPVDEEDLRFGGIAQRASLADPGDFLAARPRVVALCHPDWRGIRAATYGQCEHVLEVAGFKTRAHARRLAGFLQDCGAERVIMNGFPPGTELLGAALREVAPSIRFFIVYHGTPALSYGEDAVLQHMIELFEQGALHKLGFVKHGLAEYFRGRGCRAEYVMNICRLPALAPAPMAVDGRTRVGVFAPAVSHKNVETQVLAALMIPGADVHTIGPVAARYLQAEQRRVTSHRLMPRTDFLALLRSMHATSYVSLVECYPMTVLESIFSGAVCVTSNTSVIFQDDAVLQNALVVAHHDSPAAIARTLSLAIERRAELVPRAQRHLEQLNHRAERRWAEFIDD